METGNPASSSSSMATASAAAKKPFKRPEKAFAPPGAGNAGKNADQAPDAAGGVPTARDSEADVSGRAPAAVTAAAAGRGKPQPDDGTARPPNTTTVPDATSTAARGGVDAVAGGPPETRADAAADAKAAKAAPKEAAKEATATKAAATAAAAAKRRQQAEAAAEAKAAKEVAAAAGTEESKVGEADDKDAKKGGEGGEDRDAVPPADAELCLLLQQNDWKKRPRIEVRCSPGKGADFQDSYVWPDKDASAQGHPYYISHPLFGDDRQQTQWEVVGDAILPRDKASKARLQQAAALKFPTGNCPQGWDPVLLKPISTVAAGLTSRPAAVGRYALKAVTFVDHLHPTMEINKEWKTDYSKNHAGRIKLFDVPGWLHAGQTFKWSDGAEYVILYPSVWCGVYNDHGKLGRNGLPPPGYAIVADVSKLQDVDMDATSIRKMEQSVPPNQHTHTHTHTHGRFSD